MHTLEGQVADLAARQHGLITRAQLADLGIGDSFAHRRRVNGHWMGVAPGVYGIRGAPATFHRRILIAQLAAGPDALVSHRTALYLRSIAPSRRVPVEVTIPRGRSHQQSGVIVHESRDLDRAEPSVIDGIRVTGLARSLLDLGAVQPSAVRRTVWAARRTHGIAWPELLATLAAHGRRGRSGVGPLRLVVAEHYGEVAGDSATEDFAHALLIDSPMLPRHDRQVPARCADGVVVTADLGWPRFKALIEIDGVDHLTNEDLQQTDRHRRNQLELAGYKVLNYTGHLLRERPDQFIRDARRLLEQCGWTG